MKNTPIISILICANRINTTLCDLVASIRNQSLIELCEVIFVSTGLSAENEQELKKWLGSLPCKTTHVPEERKGIWVSRKTSYELAKGKWLFILDDDNRLDNDAIFHLLDFVDSHPDVGGICPRITADWEKAVPRWLESFGRRWCLSYNESGEFSPRMDETIWQQGQLPKIVPPGGGMIIRKNIADAFLESYTEIRESLKNSPGLGAEDYPLYMHILRCGFATAYVPSIRVFHRIPASRLTMKFLSRENFRMAYAYGQLLHSDGQRLSLSRKIRGVLGFVWLSLSSPPYHPLALWLHFIRITSHLAGVLDIRINVKKGKSL